VVYVIHYIYIYFICHLWFNLGKDIVKGVTKVKGHSFFKIVCLKNHKGIIIIWIVMKRFGLFFINCKVYMFKAWHKSKLFLHIQSIQTSRVDNPYFFKHLYFYQMCTILFENWRGFLNWWLEEQKYLNWWIFF
jgi:hypothetical protein